MKLFGTIHVLYWKKSPVLWLKPWEAGIVYFADICDENGKAVSYTALSDKIRSTLTWLQYESIKKSIPG